MATDVLAHHEVQYARASHSIRFLGLHQIWFSAQPLDPRCAYFGLGKYAHLSSFVVDRDCPEHNQSLDRTLIIMDYNLFTTWVFLLFTKRSWRLSCSRGSSLRWGGSRTLNPPTCTGGAQCESSKRFLSPDYWVMFLNVCDLRDTSSIYIWILYIASNLGT